MTIQTKNLVPPTIGLSPTDSSQDATSDDEAKCAADKALYSDQDDVQAVMQPAMSRVASHLTSIHTPAIEKAAAMERRTGFFDTSSAAHPQESSSEDGNATRKPRETSAEKHQKHGGSASLTLPEPYRSQNVYKKTTSQQTRTILGSAFAPTRHHRSGSTGQETFRRLQKALPSLTLLPTNFFNNLTDSIPTISVGTHAKSPKSEAAASPQPQEPSQTTCSTPVDSHRTSLPPSRLKPRPAPLRRTTSDESLFFHTLSRESSLGDDDRFHHVREMVNMRLLALKDSLPDVPNFKMPSLAKLQASARRSQLSINGIFSSDSNVEARSPDFIQSEIDSPTKLKDHIDDVLPHLTGDVVILGGYRGSVLRSAEPPHHQLWAPVKLGLNLRKVDLEVGLEEEDEATMPQRIIPSGMLKNIGPIDISRKLFRKLRNSSNAQAGRLRVWDFGYDWRLSPRRVSKTLQDFLATLPCNKPGVPPESRGALVIAHSLGGLITRHAVNQRPDLFSGVLYAGVPHQCMNILGPLRNGDAVLFNEKLLTAKVNFSIRTSFALLPEDGFCFVDKKTGEKYPVDFLDPMSWVKWRLSPCIEAPLPPLSKPPSTPSLTSIFPQSILRPRSESGKSEKKENEIDPVVPSMNNGTRSPTTTMTSAAAVADAPTEWTEESWLEQADEERRQNYRYLKRTLADMKLFRREMEHKADHERANAYPPLAILYGKNIPTVFAAGVAGREGIACSDAYDDLVFGSGDGVTLAKEAMLPPGYHVVRGGRVSTERGHITLLGDMPALGRALSALLRGRQKGIGLGTGGRAGESGRVVV